VASCRVIPFLKYMLAASNWVGLAAMMAFASAAKRFWRRVSAARLAGKGAFLFSGRGEADGLAEG